MASRCLDLALGEMDRFAGCDGGEANEELLQAVQTELKG
jgi:hypothetical protein